MVRGQVKDGRVHFSYTKCGGMSIHYIDVDEEWFNKQDTENLTAEELDELAKKDQDNSKSKGTIQWWGLG